MPLTHLQQAVLYCSKATTTFFLPPADFEKGFIRAETIAYDDFVDVGGFSAAKEKGLLRLEGKEYIVSEGDIMTFRFAT